MMKQFDNPRDAALALLQSAAHFSTDEAKLLGEMTQQWSLEESWVGLMLSALLDREGLPPLAVKIGKIDALRMTAASVARRRALSSKDRVMAAACATSTSFAIDNLDWLDSFGVAIPSARETEQR
jgi:hypothetical protein